MAWTYEETFDSLTTGDLNGQSSWSGATNFDVSTTGPYQGAKGVVATGDGTERAIQRSATYLANGDSGTFYISLRSNDNSGGGSNDRWIFKIIDVGQIQMNYQAGKIGVRYNTAGSSMLDIVTSFTANQWYRFGFQINNSAKTFKVNVNNGAWSSDLAFENNAVGAIGRLDFEMGSAVSGQVAADYISPNFDVSGDIQFGASQNRNNGNSSTPSLTTGTISGTNKILIAAITAEADGTTVSSCTFGGVAMTQLGSYLDINDGAQSVSLWYLVNPADGTGTSINATLSGSTPWSISAVSYTGVDQSSPFVNTATNAYGVGSSGSKGTVSDRDGSWNIGVIQVSNSGLLMTGGGIARQSVFPGTSTACFIIDSNGGVANGVTNTFTWTNTSGQMGTIVAMMRPVQAAAGPVNMKTWDGLVKASVKTMDGLALADVKTWNGLT